MVLPFLSQVHRAPVCFWVIVVEITDRKSFFPANIFCEKSYGSTASTVQPQNIVVSLG